MARATTKIRQGVGQPDKNTERRRHDQTNPKVMKMTIAATPKIAITNTDNRQIDNFRIAVAFLINGQPHFDYEDHGTFNRVATDGLNAVNGKWDGKNWVGNFLYTEASQSTQKVLLDTEKALAATDTAGWNDPGTVLPQITIIKEDGRGITGLHVAADFTINGQPHTDYEDIGPFDRHYGLVLNAMNGTWDGTKWVGNFLRAQYSGVETQIDPGLLTFLNVLVILCLAAADALAVAEQELGAHQGGGWQLRQLI